MSKRRNEWKCDDDDDDDPSNMKLKWNEHSYGKIKKVWVLNCLNF